MKGPNPADRRPQRPEKILIHQRISSVHFCGAYPEVCFGELRTVESPAILKNSLVTPGRDLPTNPGNQIRDLFQIGLGRLDKASKSSWAVFTALFSLAFPLFCLLLHDLDQGFNPVELRPKTNPVGDQTGG